MNDTVHKYRFFFGPRRNGQTIGYAWCGEETTFYRPLTALDLLLEPNCEACLDEHALGLLGDAE